LYTGSLSAIDVDGDGKMTITEALKYIEEHPEVVHCLGLGLDPDLGFGLGLDLGLDLGLVCWLFLSYPALPYPVLTGPFPYSKCGFYWSKGQRYLWHVRKKYDVRQYSHGADPF
jgi:hypothetical protein